MVGHSRSVEEWYRNLRPSLRRDFMLTRWWFQTFLIFTTGEDSHFERSYLTDYSSTIGRRDDFLTCHCSVECISPKNHCALLEGFGCAGFWDLQTTSFRERILFMICVSYRMTVKNQGVLGEKIVFCDSCAGFRHPNWYPSKLTS